ncbi:MAG: transposase, partial [Kiritimatiellaeota bacterium]|nr:transposase [Kiritimatiellota bacterium]
RAYRWTYGTPMSRALRLQFAGAIYHITVRGNGRQVIFGDDGDRRLLYSSIEKSVELGGVRIYLFCLMDNHFHLVVETPKGNLASFMQSLLTGYTVCYNLRHRRHGHLTQGRYGARLVFGDDYLLKLSRYVHLNPIKVKAWSKGSMEERLAHLRAYRWSSYLGYIGAGERVAWVDYGPMLALVGGKNKAAAYRQFVETGAAGDDPEFLEAMNASARSIGSADYCAWVDEQHASRMAERRHPQDVAFRQPAGKRRSPVEVLQAVAHLAGTSVNALAARRRGYAWKGIAALLLMKHAGLTGRAAASALGLRGGSGVSYQIAQARKALYEDASWSKRIERLERNWA